MKPITLITPYPNPDDRHAKNTGVGSYSSYLVEALIAHGASVTIYAQRDEGLGSYEAPHLTVSRVWEKTFGGLWDLLKRIWRDKPPVIHIQHEFNMFGQELLLPFTPLIPLVARLSGSRVITTFHGGTGLACIDRDFVRENGKKLPPWIIRLAFHYIFGFFALFSHQIIVHEGFQKDELTQEHHISAKKISVIPHGVPERIEIIDPAREKLGITDEHTRVFLFMGFAAPYKGLPELYEAYKKYISTHSNTLLIVGSGPAPRLAEDEEYMSWYHDLEKKFTSLEASTRWVGFIPGSDISTYYSACDAVVFPYSRRLAASGPMALAIGYEKDIILSSILLGKKDFVFDFGDITPTHEMKQERGWDRIGEETIKIYQK